MAGAREQLDRFKLTLADSVFCLKEALDQQAKNRQIATPSKHTASSPATQFSFDCLLSLADQLLNEKFLALMTERPQTKSAISQSLEQYIDSLYSAIQAFNRPLLLTDAGHSHLPQAPLNLLIRKAVEQIASQKERLLQTQLPEYYRLQAIFPDVCFAELNNQSYAQTLNVKGIVLTDDGKYALDVRHILDVAVVTRNPILMRSQSNQIALSPTEVERVLNYFGQPAIELYQAICLLSRASKIGAIVASNVADLEKAYKEFMLVVNQETHPVQSSFGLLGWQNLARALVELGGAKTIQQQVEFIAKNLDVVYWRGFVDLLETDPNRRAELALHLIDRAGNASVVLSQFDLRSSPCYHSPALIIKYVRSEMWHDYIAFIDTQIGEPNLLIEFATFFEDKWPLLFKWGLLDSYLRLPTQACSEACLLILSKLSTTKQQMAFISALPPSQQTSLIRAYLFTDQRSRHAPHRQWQAKLELLLAQSVIEPEMLGQFLFEYVPADQWFEVTKNDSAISESDYELMIRYMLKRCVTDDSFEGARFVSIVGLLSCAGLGVSNSPAQHQTEYLKLAKFFNGVLAQQFSERYVQISSLLRVGSIFGFDEVAFLAASMVHLDLEQPHFKDFIPSLLRDQAGLAQFLTCLPATIDWQTALLEKLGKNHLVNTVLFNRLENRTDATYQELMARLDKLLSIPVATDQPVLAIKMIQAALYYFIRKDGPGHETWSASIVTAIGIFAKPDKDDKCRACQLFMNFCVSGHPRFTDYLATLSHLPANLTQQYAGTLGKITGNVKFDARKNVPVLKNH